MYPRLLLLLLLIGFPALAAAQQVPTKLVVKFSPTTTVLSWSWSPTSPTDVALGFRVKCGMGPGNYTIMQQLDAPGVRSMLLSRLIKTIGTYYCVVAAFNQAGESPPSQEVTLEGAVMQSTIVTR